MYKLLQELANGSEITVSLTRISAKGGLGVVLASMLVLVALAAMKL